VEAGRLNHQRGGSGEPLVLLHGLGADSNQVLGALPPPPGIRCIALDMPGHGGSPPGWFAFSRFAALTRGVLDRMGILRAVVGGISMGAGISLRVALDAPERVSGLILIRPSWLDGPALPHLGIVARVGQWQQGEWTETEEKLAADPEFQRLEAENPGAAQSVRGLLIRPQAQEAAAVLEQMVMDRPLDNREGLAMVAAKSLVLANDGDPLHPIAVAHEIASRLPASEFHLIPSRYLEPAEHVAALQAQVAAFLNQLGAY